MIRNIRIKLVYLIVILMLSVIAAGAVRYRIFSLKDYIALNSLPVISPDYSGIVIPPNIAPLNFYIKEDADFYCVKIYSKNSKPIKIYNKTGAIRIPFKPWKKLLSKNKGNVIYFEIFINKQNKWKKFPPIVNKISEEEIDGFLVFRSLFPQFNMKAQMYISMRNLENYKQKVIIDQHRANGCFNCHTFFQKKTNKFIIQARYKKRNYMILVNNGKVSLITPKYRGPGSAYLSWHPSGDVVALTSNMRHVIFNFLTGVIPEEKLVYFDTEGDIILYNINTNTVTTSPHISLEDRIEMQPEWSADGKYLYYLSTPKIPVEEHEAQKYDLMQIGYDIDKNTWGKPEILVSHKDTGKGVTFPKASPDGRFLLFTMPDYSSFSIFRSSTDIYLMDLATKEYRRLEINSERTDAYHSWSSNSRWFVYITKRDDGVFTRPYFSYVDKDGSVSKPFVLPQKDPHFYDTFNRAFNVPELVSEPIRVNTFSFAKEIIAIEKIIESELDEDLIDAYTQASPVAGDYEGKATLEGIAY